MPTNFKTIVNQAQVSEWISQGKSRQFILDALADSGAGPQEARKLYYTTIKDIIPSPDLFENHKQVVIQQNLDRLEGIIENCIDGNTGEKKVALQAIAELNKMCGVYDSNKVTIAKSREGDEIIQIAFDK